MHGPALPGGNPRKTTRGNNAKEDPYLRPKTKAQPPKTWEGATSPGHGGDDAGWQMMLDGTLPKGKSAGTRKNELQASEDRKKALQKGFPI